jgi:enoyl-CoA hydratase/carnithine racemase
VTTEVTIDLAGGQVGGAARYRTELNGYLERRARPDVTMIGARRQIGPAWLAAREALAMQRSRRIALNNVGFLTPGRARLTLLRNAMHFLTASEMAALGPRLRAATSPQAGIVHRAARRSDVLVAPCTAMAERIATALPDVADRVVVRMHPVSAATVPARPRGALILCPVLFSPYKHMADRISEWLAAVDDVMDDAIRLVVTARPAEVPASLAASPRLHFVGRLAVERMRDLR